MSNLEHSQRIPRGVVSTAIASLLARRSMFAADAKTLADCMLLADALGRRSGGHRQLEAVLELIELGQMDPRARLLPISQTAAVANFDGSTGCGAVAATQALKTACELAQTVGVGTVTVTNCRWAGEPATHLLHAAENGLIGHFRASAPASLAWPDTDQAVCSGGLSAWAVPCTDEPPVMWSREITTANFAEAWIGDVLCGPLSGRKLPVERTRPVEQVSVELFVQVFDPAHFGGQEAFAKKMKAGWPHGPQQSPESSAGFLSLTRSHDFEKDGIPLDELDVELLQSLAAKLRVELPTELQPAS